MEPPEDALAALVVNAPLIMMLVFLLSLSLSMVRMGTLSLYSLYFRFLPVPLPAFLVEPPPRVLVEDRERDGFTYYGLPYDSYC